MNRRWRHLTRATGLVTLLQAFEDGADGFGEFGVEGHPLSVDHDGRRAGYAKESLRYAKRLPSSSLDDVTSTRTSLGGVPMPEIFHDGVVRSRLSDLLDLGG
jgi:hypothetical protein